MKFKDLIESDYQIYHNQYSSAIDEVIKFLNKKNFKMSEDDIWKEISTGPKKPSEGKTNKFNIVLYTLDDKETKKRVHFQIYGMKDKYELNMYIS